MMRIPHKLQDESPKEAPFIQRFTRTSYDFKRLTARYDEVNQHIFRIKTEPTTDEVLEKLKKRRLKLKDEIVNALAKLQRRM